MTLRMQSIPVILKSELVVRKNQHPLGFRESLPMIFLVIPYLYLIFVDPFEEPVQTILEVLSLGALIGLTILHLVRSWREADEVQLAAARFSVATGAVLGLVGAMALVVIMRHTPSLAEFIASVAGFSRNELPPAAVGPDAFKMLISSPSKRDHQTA